MSPTRRVRSDVRSIRTFRLVCGKSSASRPAMAVTSACA